MAAHSSNHTGETSCPAEKKKKSHKIHLFKKKKGEKKKSKGMSVIKNKTKNIISHMVDKQHFKLLGERSVS